MATERWSSRPGFLLATVGAAVGLGNIWRFPAVLGTNGGGAYLVPYLLAVGCCAVPLLVLELAVGRRLRTDVVSAFRGVGPGYGVLGWAVAGGVLLVLSYYLVLTGWVFGFLGAWATGGSTTFAAFTAGWLPVGCFVAVTVLVAAVVSLGVRDGIERLARVVMPTVFLLLAGIAAYNLTLPGRDAALAFLFTPDLSVLGDPGLWSAAFGQVFFSLSVGQGIMLTYGSYLDDGTPLVRSSLVIAAADVAAALLAGLVIFPVVFTAGLTPTLGTELAFTTLPEAFGAMPFGRVVAVGFFGLLLLAALTSAVSLLEVVVAAAANATRLDRRRATAGATALVFVLGLPSALSYSPVRLAVAGRPVLDLVDESAGTYALPLSALCLVAAFVWAGGAGAVRAELGRLDPLVRYAIPAVLVAATGAKLLGVARPAWRLLVDGAAGVGGAVFVGALAVLAPLGWYLGRRRGGR
ncbi:sodium-dependent transporter [Halosegnis marinus]|uniref:Sodium-dependent transporter n=1 Tax=Halosegnis marinus TaxID=3034023 RepID=A0ABD5ZPM4_9EURY|nr:sodium-dependent transporter [Halosegnis sp. DT85]